MIKIIEDYPNYSITESGIVTNNRTKRVVASHLNHKGYLAIRLYKNGKRGSNTIHRLVAIAFVERVEGKDVVNHKDGNCTNNHYENLEWCTQLENMQHGHFIIKTIYRPDNAGRPKKIVQQLKEGIVINEYESAHEAARQTDSNFSKICLVCRGGRRTHNGYEWRYV